MKIEVEKLQDEELTLTEDIPAESWEMDSFDIKFVDDIHMECTFRKVGREILVNCTVKTPLEITCSRCLEHVKQNKEYDITLSYSIGNLGEELEVDKDVREEVLLNFPMKVLCDPECKGICPGCGVNLNDGECECINKE